MSTPFVLYVREPEVKGSLREGLDGERLGAGAEVEVVEVAEKGCEDSRRIAWVIVGWKSPP